MYNKTRNKAYFMIGSRYLRIEMVDSTEDGGIYKYLYRYEIHHALTNNHIQTGWTETSFDSLLEAAKKICRNCNLDTNMIEVTSQNAKILEKFVDIPREDMTPVEEAKYIEALYSIYEKEGFALGYWNFLGELKKYHGQPFTVLCRNKTDEDSKKTVLVWKIQFEDGYVTDAYADEIIPSVMHDSGCPRWILDGKRPKDGGLKGYARYKLEWMIDHGHSLDDLIAELNALQSDDSEDGDRASTSVSELFDEWVSDVGFGSEIWACEDEWAESEEA